MLKLVGTRCKVFYKVENVPKAQFTLAKYLLFDNEYLAFFVFLLTNRRRRGSLFGNYRLRVIYRIARRQRWYLSCYISGKVSLNFDLARISAKLVAITEA